MRDLRGITLDCYFCSINDLMRIIYLIMFFTLRYSTWIIYPRFRRVSGPKSFYGRTIFVSNHPASFMDPLVIAAKQRSILFFMTRSDVFTKFTKPFLWACQMLPIYRQLDGGDTRSKNDLVFEKTSKILSRGRNLLILEKVLQMMFLFED